ncbi:MAG: diphosphomevalonate decarboxylase [Acidobacteriota bacterium]|jgi:diphosphomevalonate decarboxylase
MTRMPRRATVSAPANIALIKYWGARDPRRVIPYHPSISITLEVCRSVTTVEALPPETGRDEVFLARDGEGDDTGRGRPPEPLAPDAPFAARVLGHLDVLRAHTGRSERFRVATRNTFPAAAGLASSASGFAALACAVTRALGIDGGGGPEPSTLARLSGSGSAARSVFGGYVQWPGAGRAPDGPAERIAPAEHWDLRDVIALVQSGPKEVSSLEGHRRAPTSPHFARRLELVGERLESVRRAIGERDLDTLGPLIERDAVELHAVAMTSEPPVFYWQPGTLEVLEAVRALRRSGVSAWSTMDAGANVHVICPPGDEAAVASRLAAIPAVHDVIRDRVGTGPRPEPEDLLEGSP